MEPTTLPTHSPELIWRQLGDELVIVRPSDGLVTVLNGVGAIIWQAIDGERTISEIARLVCEEYDVTQQQAEGDIVDLMNQLEGEGLVVLEDTDA